MKKKLIQLQNHMTQLYGTFDKLLSLVAEDTSLVSCNIRLRMLQYQTRTNLPSNFQYNHKCDCLVK